MINAQEARVQSKLSNDIFSIEKNRVEHSIKQAVDDGDFFAVIVINDSVRKEIISWLEQYGFSVPLPTESCTVINWKE
jgi:hypothetical protein